MSLEATLLPLGIMLLFAVVGAIISFKIKQPLIVALLLVGAIIGPNAFGLIKDTHMIDNLIEIGAIILLFVVGMEFDLTKLAKLGTKALLVGLLKIGISLFFAFLVMSFFLPVKIAVILAITVSFSSTVVIVKILEQKNLIEKKEVPLMIGMLIIEDIVAVVMITFFNSISSRGGNLLDNLSFLIISMIAMIVLYVIFYFMLGPLARWIKKNTNEEMVTLSIGFFLCIFFSYIAFLMKLSPTIGAFLAGSLVASLPEAKSFEKKIDSFTISISAIFFICMGTMVNFKSLGSNMNIVLIMIITVAVSTLLSVGLVTYLFASFKAEEALFSSFAMFSIGEFSLLLAKEAGKLNLGIDIVTITGAIIFFTALIMSMTIAYSSKLYKPIDQNAPREWKRKIHKLSHFIRGIFEEVDLENKYSTKLKNEIFKIFFFFIGAVIIAIMGKSIAKLMFLKSILPVLVYITIGVFVVGAVLLLIAAFRRILDIFGTVTIMFSNRYFMNLKKSRKLLMNLSISFLLLFMALFSPIIFLVIELPKTYGILIPVSLFIMSLVPFLKCMATIDSHPSCHYCGKQDNHQNNFFKPVHHLVQENNSKSFVGDKSGKFRL